MNNKRLIDGYGVFVNGEWDLSPFEHLYELQCRDVIQEQMDTFSALEKEEVEKLDKVLIKRAPLFCRALDGFLEGARENMPEKHWWWYLDKIVN